MLQPLDTIGDVELEVILLGIWGTFATGLGLTIHRLRRRNRVTPSVKTTAPTSWLWSLRLAPRLHRRLRRTTAVARQCMVESRDQLGLAELVCDLERHACEIDRQLVVVSRMPQPQRNRLLRELEAEARQVDALAERIIRMGRAWAGVEPSARALAPVAERLDALDSALRDVARLDRSPSPR